MTKTGSIRVDKAELYCVMAIGIIAIAAMISCSIYGILAAANPEASDNFTTIMSIWIMISTGLTLLITLYFITRFTTVGKK